MADTRRTEIMTAKGSIQADSTKSTSVSVFRIDYGVDDDDR